MALPWREYLKVNFSKCSKWRLNPRHSSILTFTVVCYQIGSLNVRLDSGMQHMHKLLSVGH